MHKYRIGFLTGLATGYVLGAKAGRERYEQIKAAARSFAEHPSVQQAAGAVQAQASGLASSAGTKISDRVPKIAKDAKNKAAEKVPGLRHKDDESGQSTHDGHGSGKSATNGHREHSTRRY